ncbi:uncharacterized protein LOC122502698 [Leptopilina heterotoma]|uniref:uncharacterized protein LOC122502698 n=1 Tax=Leptopilina heterotoma TaxID=63436 RepID=UPI001CA9AD50|nr:uncharacterized protein LOC122502698 [Leptopilina heterotoma]
MHYFVFLLCTLLVHFTQSSTVVNNVEDDISINNVPDYEVMPVGHMIHKRSPTPVTRTSFTSNVDKKHTIKICRNGKCEERDSNDAGFKDFQNQLKQRNSFFKH